jgi:hypothetical protein
MELLGRLRFRFCSPGCFFDYVNHGLGVRYVDGVAASNFSYSRTGTARHELFCWNRIHFVLSDDQIPTRFRFPRRRANGSIERVQSPGTWEFAMNSAFSGGTSPANDSANFVLSSMRKPLIGGSMGGTGAPGAGFAISVLTDSPASGAKAVT